MKKQFLISYLLFSITFLIAQQNTPRVYKEVNRIGIGYSSFRDMATSPLVYEGPTLNFSSGKWKINENRETFFGKNILLGFNTATVENQTTNSILIGTTIHYTYLRQLKRFTTSNWDYKVGGKIDALMLMRANADLGNNSLGFEAFPTLFGSFKITKKFTRPPFLRRKKAPRKQELSFSLDIGLVNNTFRNDFAYTSHAPFYNDNNIFKDHQFNWLTGFRMKSSIDYVVYNNKNSNALKVAYKWEGIHTGNTPDKFAMSNGVLQFSLLHRLN